MRAGSGNRGGLAGSKSEARKRSHYARPRLVSFDDRSYEAAILAVESCGHLGKEGSDLIDQMAASIVERTDESSLARKASARIAFSRSCQ